MALSAARVQTTRLGDSAVIDLLKVPMKASTIGYQGGMACINAGYAAPATAALGLLVVGRFERTYDNSAGAAGAVNAEIRRGTFKWGNSGSTDLIAQADVGKLCYAVDDATVALTDANGTRSVAGRILGVETDGVWVEMGGAGAEAAAGLEEAGEVRSIISIPVTLTSIVDGQLVGAFTPGFAGRIIKTQFITTTVASTASKLSTLQPRITGVATTGGAVALTTAGCNALGEVTAGTAITALNTFGAADTIDVQASATTAFIEGAGVLLISLG
jgi:hypothetical protein